MKDEMKTLLNIEPAADTVQHLAFIWPKKKKKKK